MGAESIAGGFIPIDVGLVVHAWTACQARPLGIGDFRAWLATHEMAARRKSVRESAIPFFGVAELARLTGTTTRTAAASVRRLVAAGVLEWSETAIGFPSLLSANLREAIGDTIGRGRGPVLVPRRLLRFLARGCRPALIATALGALLRCVSRRRAGFGVRGRLACSWIARAFGVDLRRAKEARAELVALGWLAPEPTSAWSTNRWGSAWTVNLGWKPSVAIIATVEPRDDCHPAVADPGASLPPPDLTPIPYREKSDPEPAGRGPTGVSLGNEGKPNLRDIRPSDIEDPARVVELHRQAVTAGWTTASEADRLRVLAAAEHARTVGTSNPPGLFRAIVEGRRWGLLTQRDEDTAARRLREHQRTPRALDPKITASVTIRSPYGAERPSREPSSLAGLLARSLARQVQQSE